MLLRDEYQQLKDKAESIEEEFIRTYEKKKSVNKEKRAIKQQKDEADKYITLFNGMFRS